MRNAVAAHSEPRVVPGAPQHRSLGWRVLVVAAEPQRRADVKRLLLAASARGYAFEDVASGAEAIASACHSPAGPPDCAIFDAALPDISASAFLAALHDARGLPLCSTVALIDGPTEGQRQDLLSAGVSDCLARDEVTSLALTRAVERALELWSMKRELRAQRQALEASEAQFRQLLARTSAGETQLRLALQASRTGIWTWNWDTDVVTWSAECYDIHGIAANGFDGTGASFFKLVHPDDRPRVQDTVRTAIETRQLYQCEFRILRPDGRLVWVENLGRASDAAHGESTTMMGTITDVSRRKQTEAKLASSEERFARAQRAAHVGTWDWNVLTGEAIWTNEAWRLFGREPRDAPVSYDIWLDSVHPDDRAAASQTTLAAIQRGAHYRDEFRVQTPDGSVRWVASAGESLLDVDGKPVRMLGTVQDVTERHKAEEALRSALRQAEQLIQARDHLLSVVSHDLRNPLAAMTMTIEVLRSHLAQASVDLGTSHQTEIISRMARQAKRMERLLDELLDVAQLHAGNTLSLNCQEVDLVALVRGISHEYQLTAKDHKLTLRTACPTLRGCWDERRLERVINNLLSNAVKYSPSGGQIWVDLHVDAGDSAQCAVLSVSDSGIGIPVSERVRIFEWFARGRNAQGSKIPGSGIGLAAARHVVEQHGGSISVEGNEGEGARFVVVLPIRS